MKDRCRRVGSRNYKNYGGRGITVCDEWRDNFESFKAWGLANGYAPGLEIDRIDNNGNYEPGNCRWVTRTVNANNKRNTRFLTAFGETKSVDDWMKDPRCVPSNKRTLHNRLSGLGWDDERALATPLRPH